MQMEIAGRVIGDSHPPLIVAEISANHLQDLERAKQLVVAASEVEADAVKLQTYHPDSITIDSDSPDFTIESGPWVGKTLHELYSEAYTPWEWHEELFDLAESLGLIMFSSPFDREALGLLETLSCPAYKIASFELVDIGLISAAADTGKPLLISTGMADEEEIREALTVVGDKGPALLHAVSAYPSAENEANLLRMLRLKQVFQTIVGISDHSRGTFVAACAAAMGAAVIEKHLTLRRTDGGPDAEFSLEPSEFRQLVLDCKRAWRVRGSGEIRPGVSERGNVELRRSLYVTNDISEGELFTPHNVRSVRPGKGLAPKHMPQVLGRRASRDLLRGTALSWDDIL
jgi:pseudaminic acid synthase